MKGRLTIIFLDASCHQNTIIKTIEFFNDQVITEHTPLFTSNGPDNYEETIQKAVNFIRDVPPPNDGVDLITVEQCAFERLRNLDWEEKMRTYIANHVSHPFSFVSWERVKHLAEMVIIY